MRDVVRGASCFLRGFSLMAQPRVRRYAAAPIILSTLVFAVAIWFFVSQFSIFVTGMTESVPDWLVWLEWVAWFVFAGLAAGLIIFTFVLTVGILGAPFHAFLAEAAEKHLSGQPIPPTPIGKTLLRLPLTLIDEMTKVAYCLLVAVPFLILFLIPGINIAAPFLWFLCCAWVTGFSYADYALSNHGLKFREIRRTLARRRLLALGFGGMAFLAFMIPLLNVVAVPAAVCGGALLWVEELGNRSDPGP